MLFEPARHELTRRGLLDLGREVYPARDGDVVVITSRPVVERGREPGFGLGTQELVKGPDLAARHEQDPQFCIVCIAWHG